MSDYEPLNLSVFCNAGPDARRGREVRTGEIALRGIPFRVGSVPDAPCFLAFGGRFTDSVEPVVIPVGKPATRVIFCHIQLESQLEQGDMPGRGIAVYRFRYVDGSVMEAPIRERFEIASFNAGWGGGPFLAEPDSDDRLWDRSEGKWADIGQRLTENIPGWPRDYYLWTWENPRPDVILAAIEVQPVGRSLQEPVPDGASRITPFLIAGVTLSHLDESPFYVHPAVPVKLTLSDPADAAAPFALDVQVDRGVATYPFALPRDPAEAFLDQEMCGFGEPQNEENSPAWVRIAAAPSATVTVRKANEEIARVRWGALEEQGKVDAGRVRFELVEEGRNWVHTTVLDDDTGKPIPCRIHFRSPDGIPYAPHGHQAYVHSNLPDWGLDLGGEMRLGQITYAYIDGRCQGWLPTGDVIVDAARGFEYEPLRTRVTILPGQRELVLRLRRSMDLKREGYVSGDTHVHFLHTQGALLEAAAEELHVVNLLMTQFCEWFSDIEEFTGRPVVSHDSEVIVHTSQENRQHFLGHLSLLGLKEMVMPFCSDGPPEAETGGNMETTLSRWADACHAQGGTVIIPHMPLPNGERATLIATGRADAVEMLDGTPFAHLEYYRYLNGGYRLPLVGGTDRMDNSVPVGLYRTYAFVPPDEPFTHENWLKGIRKGNCFLSSGPMIWLRVGGQPMGSTVRLRRGGGTVEVMARVKSVFPVHRLEIVVGGRVVRSTEEADGARFLRLKIPLKIDRDTWICARCGGPGYNRVSHHDVWKRNMMAHTSPVYVACGGDYNVCSPETMQYMMTLVNGSLEYVRKQTHPWQPGRVTHHHDFSDHQAFLEEPFQQALSALHLKMHQNGIPH